LGSFVLNALTAADIARGLSVMGIKLADAEETKRFVDRAAVILFTRGPAGQDSADWLCDLASVLLRLHIVQKLAVPAFWDALSDRMGSMSEERVLVEGREIAAAFLLTADHEYPRDVGVAVCVTMMRSCKDDSSRAQTISTCMSSLTKREPRREQKDKEGNACEGVYLIHLRGPPAPHPQCV
jgi:hypothetical protein